MNLFRGPEQPRATAAVRREQSRRHPDLEQLIRPTVVLPPPSTSRPAQTGSNSRPHISTKPTGLVPRLCRARPTLIKC